MKQRLLDGWSQDSLRSEISETSGFTGGENGERTVQRFSEYGERR